MKIINLRNKENEIINRIVNNEGVMDDETKNELEFTEKEIVESVDSYAYVLKNTLAKELNYWAERKKEIETIIRRINNNKEYLQQQLHSVASQAPLRGAQWTISPDVSITTKVNIEDVTEPYGEYNVSLTGQEYEWLLEHLEKTENFENIKHKVLIKDLPKGHKALEQTIRPTIKITKTKT